MEDFIRNNLGWLILIGFAGGTLGAALGIGAGILLVPALTLALGLPQKTAQGTALAVMIPMAMMAALRYHWNPDIKLNGTMILILIPFAILGANLGASIAAWIPALVLKRCFGIFVILAGIKMILSR